MSTFSGLLKYSQTSLEQPLRFKTTSFSRPLSSCTDSYSSLHDLQLAGNLLNPIPNHLSHGKCHFWYPFERPPGQCHCLRPLELSPSGVYIVIPTSFIHWWTQGTHADDRKLCQLERPGGVNRFNESSSQCNSWPLSHGRQPRNRVSHAVVSLDYKWPFLLEDHL